MFIAGKPVVEVVELVKLDQHHLKPMFSQELTTENAMLEPPYQGIDPVVAVASVALLAVWEDGTTVPSCYWISQLLCCQWECSRET